MKKIMVMTFVSLILMTGCGCGKKENENNGNNKNETEENNTVVDPNVPTVENPITITNENITKDQTIEDLEVILVDITYDGYLTKFTSKITNKSDKIVTFKTVMATIKYMNEYDEERTLEMEVYSADILEPGETNSVLITVDIDFRKVLSIDYRILDKK